MIALVNFFMWLTLGLIFIVLLMFYIASFFIGRRFNKNFDEIPPRHFRNLMLPLYFWGIGTQSIKTFIYIKAIVLANDKKVFKQSLLKYTNYDFRQFAKKWEIIYCKILFVLYWLFCIFAIVVGNIYFVLTYCLGS